MQWSHFGNQQLPIRQLVLQRRLLNLVSYWPEIASRKARPQSCQAHGQVAMKRPQGPFLSNRRCNTRIAVAAPIGHWSADPKGSINKALAESWWQAFLRSTLDDAQRSQLSEYLVGEILANDSGLASEWLVLALSHRNSCFVNLLNLAQDLDYWTQASIMPVGDTHRDESRPD